MKKIITVIFLLLGVVSMAQVRYESSWVILENQKYETQFTNRIITISDTEISISRFIGNNNTPFIETQYLIVNEIIEKDWGIFDGVCKTYYCTTKDVDFINGYQKVIIYIKKRDVMKMAVFADEITVFVYQFKLSK